MFRLSQKRLIFTIFMTDARWRWTGRGKPGAGPGRHADNGTASPALRQKGPPRVGPRFERPGRNSTVPGPVEPGSKRNTFRVTANSIAEAKVRGKPTNRLGVTDAKSG